MIHPALAAFDVSFGIESASACDIALEVGGILSEVVPESRQTSPLGLPETRCKLARQIAHRAQMLLEVVDLKGPILIPTHMCQISRHT